MMSKIRREICFKLPILWNSTWFCLCPNIDSVLDQVLLDDGEQIFAPSDFIKARIQ